MRPLISVLELAEEHSSITILDIRYKLGGPPGPAEFAAGHIAGARYVDLDADLAAPPGQGGRHPLPSAEAFTRAMQRAGVDAARPVVVYDDWGARAAGRAWWLLRYFGHGSVRVLDGGWGAWRAAGRPIETGAAPVATPGTFVAVAGGMPVVTAGDLGSVGVLIDARAPERFRGDVEPVDPVAGHIPGAVNVPTSANLDEAGRFRAPAELAAIYARAGATPDAAVGVYCGSGVTAAHDVLALELAGIRARLYPGSWSEYIVDPARPVARGAEGN